MKRLSLALLLALFSISCGGDDPDPNSTANEDAGVDAGTDASGNDAHGADDAGDAGDTGPSTTLCSPCTDDVECGADNLCLTLADGVQNCGTACTAPEDCPDGYFCGTVDEMTGTQQCVPEILTCTDRCDGVTCDPGQRCDPLTGACARPKRLCETDCLTDSECGDGPEDRCLNVPNTPDGERACFTGCNPEAEMRECPADYFCVPLDEEIPDQGVCFPFEGTCVDRCGSVTCGDGQNCDPVTGTCVDALLGACESGCSSSADCGGQDDVCLNLGITEEPACWQSCSEGACPAGYECLGITATSLRLCVPVERACTMCDAAACFPDGVCNPDDGTCSDLPEPCTAGTCSEGEYCDPIQLICRQLGAPCSGSSWAVDCDNVTTKCTTQKAGASGTCERLCSSDADCGDGTTCVETNVGSLCLGYREGGAQLCGAAYDLSSPVGRPCNPGFCSGAAPTCVSSPGQQAFCTRACSSDTDCDNGQRCAGGPDGTPVCLTPQCACAVDAALPTGVDAELGRAFSTLGASRCDALFEPAARESHGLNPLLGAGEPTTTLASYPTATLGARDRIAPSGSTIADAWSSALAARGRPATGSAVVPIYPGANSKLAEAVAELVIAAGGAPDLTTLDAAASTVPSTVQDTAAPYISAAARAYLARRNAIAGSTWTPAEIDTAIGSAPFLFLPGRAGDTAPDLTSANVVADYQSFPIAALEEATADLAADLDAAPTGALTDVGFSFDVATPTGRVVIGDAGSTTHDDTAGPIAVLVDIGGDDTYTGSIATNATSANGVALVVDLGGSDTWTYTSVADPNDTPDTLASDADGRIPAAGPLFTGNGPVSASTAGRQASARFGIAVALDYGTEVDTRTSLRMSQGSAVMGAAILWDEGGDDVYEAEALAQGAALGGTALLWDAAGNDTYRVWHAGQGFGTAGGYGALVDADGDDLYTAVAGGSQAAGVLYYAPVDRGASNRNLAQGAGAGIEGGIDGGIGVLTDLEGADTYDAGTYAQGHGALGGVGFLIDRAGSDTYEGRAYVQATGEHFGGGILADEDGDDDYNPTAARRQRGQGFGAEGGWGVFWDAGGADTVNYIAPAGGAGLDGGLGIALFGTGNTAHSASSDATWGYAATTVTMGPFVGDFSTGIFIDGGGADNYTRPDASIVAEGSDWRQPAAPGTERGFGSDL